MRLNDMKGVNPIGYLKVSSYFEVNEYSIMRVFKAFLEC